MEITERDQDLTAIGLLQEPVRRRLYEWVVAQGEPVGREAAAHGTGINRALAAFHLDRLVEGGLLEAGYRRLTGRTGPGAGRPARVYSRAPREVAVSLPERRYELVAELFAEALEKTSGPNVSAAVHDVAAEMGTRLGRSAEEPPGSTDRLLHVLEANGYEPAVGENGTIRLRNCPFHALVAEHRPLVCGTNLALAEGITRGAGVSGYRPIIDQQPGYCCVAFVAAD